MKPLRSLLILVLFTVLLVPLQAQESYEFPDGPQINLPVGWEVLIEADEFGNVRLSRPDGDGVSIAMPPPEDLAPVLAEQGINLEDGVEPLLESILQSEGLTLADGTLETATYGDAETLIFVTTDDSGAVRYVYLGLYPNEQIFFVEIEFDDGEIDQAMLDDIAYMFENVSFDNMSEASSDDSASDDRRLTITEVPENIRLFTMRDNTIFAVPANWELESFTEEFGSYSFEQGDIEIQFDLPPTDLIVEALADLGFAEDEIVTGLVELNITAEHSETPYDVDNIEYTDIDGGQLAVYYSEENGETLAFLLAHYDNERLAGLRVETFADYSDDFDAIVRAVIDTVTFDGIPADYIALSELVGDIEAPQPEEDAETEADLIPTAESVEIDLADRYLETTTFSFEEEAISFDYPIIWIAKPSLGSGLNADFDDIYVDAEIGIILPDAEEIAPGLEEMGIDPESETVALEIMQMLLARVDADGNMEIPPAEDINTFETDNASVASAMEMDGNFTNHFYLVYFDNGRLALLNVSGTDLPDELFEALTPLIESFEFGEE